MKGEPIVPLKLKTVEEGPSQSGEGTIVRDNKMFPIDSYLLTLILISLYSISVFNRLICRGNMVCHHRG